MLKHTLGQALHIYLVSFPRVCTAVDDVNSLYTSRREMADLVAELDEPVLS